MKKITRKEKVEAIVEKEVPVYKTVDGIEFRTEKGALKHEALITEFPNLHKDEIAWFESMNDEDDFELFKSVIKTSSDVLILIDPYDSDQYKYLVVDPILAGVTAVVKVLQGRDLGMNAHERLSGVIYKGESFSVEYYKRNHPGSLVSSCKVGSGRKISEVLK
jgi:hypothetical protein